MTPFLYLFLVALATIAVVYVIGWCLVDWRPLARFVAQFIAASIVVGGGVLAIKLLDALASFGRFGR